MTVGDELLYGQTVDTNAAWLGRALAEMGWRVVRRFTVGDEIADIQDAVSSAMGLAKVVFVSGGLGPTPDDRTKQAVAALFGRDLRVEKSVLADLEEGFSAEGINEIPTLARAQAEVPEGARILRNSWGTAPGLLMEQGGVHIILLPGVPRELKGIFAGAVRAELVELMGDGQGRLEHRVIHTTGISEPELADLVQSGLAEIADNAFEGISLAYLPDLLGVDLRLTEASGSTGDDRDRIDTLRAQLERIVGRWSFEAESGDLAEGVAGELRGSGRKLAAAESCTGGLLAKRMTDFAGSSDVFVGGMVAYSDEVKIEQLGVSAADLARCGAVSETVARQLALGVATRLRVDAGVGITGIAGPGGGSDDKPVGTVWIAVSLGGDVEAEHHRFSGDREAIRERAAQAALAALYRRLRRR